MPSKIKNYAGRSSLPPVDLLDHMKRETIKKIFPRRDDIDFASEDEKMAVLKFRTERLTLERLVEIEEQIYGLGSLLDLKALICRQIKALDTKNLPGLNDEYRKAILNLDEDQIPFIPLDSLVNVFERLSIVAITENSIPKLAELLSFRHSDDL